MAYGLDRAIQPAYEVEEVEPNWLEECAVEADMIEERHADSD